MTTITSTFQSVHNHQPLKTREYHDHHHESTHAHHHGISLSDQFLLKLSFGITFLVMIVEIVAGMYANSLALVSDGIHMFTHAFALFLSLGALIIRTKKANTQKSFGYYRAEVLAAFVNGLSIAVSVVWIVYESIERFITPEVILSETTLIVAIVGLVVNIITGLLLYKADRENINIKSAFLHMLTDALSSVAIITGAVIIYCTDFFLLDALLAFFISMVILKWAWGLIQDSLHILLEGSPLDTTEIHTRLLHTFPFIALVYDMHCWEISHNYYCFSAHIQVHPLARESHSEQLRNITSFLEKEFAIAHITLQLEHEKKIIVI